MNIDPTTSTSNTLLDLCITKQSIKKICVNWLQWFISEKVSANRQNIWLETSYKQGLNMPGEGSNIQVCNYYKYLQNFFVIFVDFEYNLKRHEKLINIMISISNYVNKLSKMELWNFAFYNYGYFLSDIQKELYQIINKY